MIEKLELIKNIFGKLLGGFFYLYFFVAAIYIFIFNWQYINENGAVRWIYFGQIVATGKALIWPYYIATKPNVKYVFPQNEPSARHFINSQEKANEAAKILIEAGIDASNVSQLDNKRTQKVISLIKMSISEANLVSDSFLKKGHPLLFEKYNRSYKTALNMMLKGWESKNQTIITNGSDNFNSFVKWMRDNEDTVFPKKYRE